MSKPIKQTNLLSISLLSFFVFLQIVNVAAEDFILENDNDSVIGELRKTKSELKDTLLDIARANGFGYDEIKRVNPNLDTWIPGDDQDILLPSKYILPDTPRNGIVLNIPEMRLYYFSRNRKDGPIKVSTYPLGIGRQGWDTPYKDTHIIDRKKHPSWYPPKSIREEHEAMGDTLPKRVKPGPDNPLGDYALRLGLPGYLIHGTNKPFGIGMRVSHGCIRLYPEDIEELYERVTLGTPVHIVNQPYKVGRLGNKIYLEAHAFMEEDAELFENNLTSVVRMIMEVTGDQPYQVDWVLAKQVIEEMKGIPVEIGIFSTAAEQVVVNFEHPKVQLGTASGIQLELDTNLYQ